MSERLSCSCDGFCVASEQEAGHTIYYLRINRWQFGAESSIIIKFIALRVEMVGVCCSQPLILPESIVPTSNL